MVADEVQRTAIVSEVLPPESADLVPFEFDGIEVGGFRFDADGVPQFIMPEVSDHVNAWRQTRQEMTGRQVLLGSIAASFVKRYGEGAIKELADGIDESENTIYWYRRTFLRCAQYFSRIKNLHWTHYAIAAHSELPDSELGEVLKEAADAQWSTRKLKYKVSSRKAAKKIAEKAPVIDPQMVAALSVWETLRPQVKNFGDNYPQFIAYVDDFLGDVDEAMNRPWESAVEWLERLIDRGTQDLELQQKATGWQRATVLKMWEELKATGNYEERIQTGGTDVARGQQRKFICKKGTPHGDSYEARRASHYSNEED